MDFHRGNHKGENPANFLRIVSALIQYHKMEKTKNKMSLIALSLPPHPLSPKAHMRKCECVTSN